jgi:hypothetical protein
MTPPNPTPAPRAQHKWWKIFYRADVLAALEEASGSALDPNDPLPDSLIANAEALGLLPAELRLFIFDEPKRADWDMNALAVWARHYGLGIYAPKAEDAAKEGGGGA